MNIYVVEPLSEESLALLEQLKSLKLIKMRPFHELKGKDDAGSNVPSKEGVIENRGKRTQRLSPETTRKWLQHVENSKDEWDRI